MNRIAKHYSWRRSLLLAVIGLLLAITAYGRQTAGATEPPQPAGYDAAWSQPSIEPFIRPEFAAEMRMLRPSILAAAERHNQPKQSGMSNREFAEVLALLLYSENVGWLDSQVTALRPVHPLFQEAQTWANQATGADLTIWPTNLRPSVALQILRNQTPVPAPTRLISTPLTLAGSQISPERYPNQGQLYAAISRELSNPPLAVEYLAANVQRGVARAHFEQAPITWQTLAAWHNQGIVTARDIRANPGAIAYLSRTAAYLPAARLLVADEGRFAGNRHLPV